MLDQIFNIVKKFGQDTVVNNPEVPNEYNQDVMADATKTIVSGFQNVMAGGGFQNILDLFKGGGKAGMGGGIGGLLKNPIVTMMIGYFISKLVSKYKMSPASASNIANNLIPNSITNLIQQTNDPSNKEVTLDNIINSLISPAASPVQEEQQSGGFSLQNLLEQFTGNGNDGSGGNGFDIQDIIGNLTRKAQNNFQDQQSSGGGLMDLIKGFIK
jgi:hypothetical protein